MPTTKHDVPHATDVDTEAVIWLVRMTSGDITTRELSDFERWRRADSRHEQALSDARRLWVHMGMPLENYYQTESLHSSSAHEHARSRLLRWQVILPVAALLIFSMAMTQSWLSRWQYDHYTSTGEQLMLSLDDGSRMWLDVDSAADVRVSSGQRFVRLARGEAFFDIVHNPLQPFIVEAGMGEIKVLGTAFGVQRDDNGMVVTVERGKVKLSRKDHTDMVLQEDQQVLLRSGADAEQITTVNAGQVLSWHQGQLVFEAQPLATILATLKRYDNRIIVLNNDRLASVKLNAIIDIHHIDDWYDGLQKSLSVKINRVGPVVWLRERD